MSYEDWTTPQRNTKSEINALLAFAKKFGILFFSLSKAVCYPEMFELN